MGAPNTTAPYSEHGASSRRETGPRGSGRNAIREPSAGSHRGAPGARGGARDDRAGVRSASKSALGLGFRAPTPIRAIGVEVVVALVFIGASAVHIPSQFVVPFALLCAVLPFVMIGGRPSYDWAVTALRYTRGSVPKPGRTTEYIDAEGIPFGVHERDHRVSCVLEVRPPEGSATRLGPNEARTDSTIDLPVLATCLVQHDITVASIDVVSHGRRTASGTPATDVYERLIGTLPAVADRTVWVTVTIDVRDNRDAVRARGAGRTGTANTVRIATERVARALDSQAIRSRTLTRNEILAMTHHLCRGVSFAALTENWKSAPLPGARNTAFGFDCSKIDAGTVNDVWSVPALSTTLTIRLGPSSTAGRVNMSAACNFVTRTTSPRLRVSGIVSMNGRQREALMTALPLAIDARGFADPRRDVPHAAASRLALPTAGCGQLLGSDSTGHGVAVRIHGLGVRSIQVAGELYLAQQLTFRAVATGARVLIRTDRPHAWGPLVDSVGAHEKLCIDARSVRPDLRFDLVVHDFSDALTEASPRNEGATTLILTEHLPRTPMRDADVTIVQPGAVGDRIHVRTMRQELDLMLVTIAQETAFIGRPRSVRAPSAAH